MQSSNIPTKIPLPFAYNAGVGYKNTIPTASQIGVVNGRASLNDGFPPLNFVPISAGGVPPFGSDVNGILNEITAITQWQQAGGFFFYDSSFSTTIGGYPKGAILQSSSNSGLWISTAENNTTNPDTGGAGWMSLAFEGSQAITVTTADVTVTQLQSAYPVLIISGAKTAARSLIMPAIVGEWIVQNNTTGAFNLTVKTASGTGVVATQSQSTFLYGDGTNILFADSSKVASFNGRVGTVTLNATDVTSALGYIPVNRAGDTMSGSLTNSSGFVGPLTGQVSLTTGPMLVGAVSGSSSQWWIGTGGAAGTSLAFYAPSGNGMEWGRSNIADMVLDTNGNVNFSHNVTMSSNQVINSSNQPSYFPAAGLGGTGWQKLPNGWIIQWGQNTYTGAPNSSQNFSLPLTFPNGYTTIVCTCTNDENAFPNISRVNNSTFNFRWPGPSGTSPTFNWIAIGY